MNLTKKYKYILAIFDDRVCYSVHNTPGPNKDLNTGLGDVKLNVLPYLFAQCFGHCANLIANNCISQVYPNYYNTASIPVIAVEAFSESSHHNKHLFEGRDLRKFRTNLILDRKS